MSGYACKLSFLLPVSGVLEGIFEYISKVVHGYNFLESLDINTKRQTRTFDTSKIVVTWENKTNFKVFEQQKET